MIEGSGSGVWPRNQVGDDEDYDKGSGSGDWSGGGKLVFLIFITINNQMRPNLKYREWNLCKYEINYSENRWLEFISHYIGNLYNLHESTIRL